MYREIVPDKLIEQRGSRTRKAVAQASGFRVTEMDLYSYETARHRPSAKKLPYLLQGLGVTFEDISEPVDLSV